MSETQNKNPLHGITLEKIVNSLVDHYGWEELGQRIDPTILVPRKNGFEIAGVDLNCEAEGLGLVADKFDVFAVASK